MNYEIIKDPEELSRFIAWLPELEKHETYYVSLMVRKKYCEAKHGIKSDQISLKRFTTDKAKLFRKIKQLECEMGSYLQGDVPVPQQGLALYITPNPRDMEKATKNCLIKFANLITQPYFGYNPHQEVLSEIQKTVGNRVYVDFDFDNTKGVLKSDFNTYIKEQILEKVNSDCAYFLETRGGLHVLINTSKIEESFAKTWYKSIDFMKELDQVSSTNLIPIAGCTQGGFTVRMEYPK